MDKSTISFISLMLLSRITNFQLTSMSLLLIEKHFIQKLPVLWSDEFDSKTTANINEDLAYFINQLERLQNEQINNILPQTIWYSFFVQTYGVFENSLHSLSNIIQKSNKLPLKENDLGDRGIIRSKKYLTKVAKLSLNIDNVHWERLLNYLDIRSNILHKSGWIDKKKDKKSLLQFIDKNENIKLLDSSKILLSKKFIHYAIKDYIKFLENILDIFDPNYKDKVMDLSKFVNN